MFQENHPAVSRVDSFVSIWLLITGPPWAVSELGSVIAQMPEECFVIFFFFFFFWFLGKEKLPLSSGAEKLIGESLREALLSTSRMKGRFCLNRLQARLSVNSSLGWIAGLCGFQALLKLPSSLLLAVCLLLKAPMFDTGQWEQSSKGRYPEHGFLRSMPPARA